MAHSMHSTAFVDESELWRAWAKKERILQVQNKRIGPDPEMVLGDGYIKYRFGIGPFVGKGEPRRSDNLVLWENRDAASDASGVGPVDRLQSPAYNRVVKKTKRRPSSALSTDSKRSTRSTRSTKSLRKGKISRLPKIPELPPTIGAAGGRGGESQVQPTPTAPTAVSGAKENNDPSSVMRATTAGAEKRMNSTMKPASGGTQAAHKQMSSTMSKVPLTSQELKSSGAGGNGSVVVSKQRLFDVPETNVDLKLNLSRLSNRSSKSADVNVSGSKSARNAANPNAPRPPTGPRRPMSARARSSRTKSASITLR
eukprot:GFYU01007991.1.p1 GENE.GFYU01007991.1~~GFYU01007991.1.p1  ORF type:complete len:312 (+),score=52.46 GFYU01007991.1:208-1143(+)